MLTYGMPQKERFVTASISREFPRSNFVLTINRFSAASILFCGSKPKAMLLTRLAKQKKVHR
jgi:hypothetical protein